MSQSFKWHCSDCNGDFDPGERCNCHHLCNVCGQPLVETKNQTICWACHRDIALQILTKLGGDERRVFVDILEMIDEYIEMKNYFTLY